MSVVNIDVADLARRSSLTESEKYNFYCNHFTPDIDYKFTCESSHSFLLSVSQKYNWLTYSRQENGMVLSFCVLYARSRHLERQGEVYQRCIHQLQEEE